MSLFSSLSVSASGMAAQRARAELLAENLANAETTRTPDGGPYRRKDAVFTSEPVAAEFSSIFAAELGHATSHMVVSNYDSFLDPRSWPDANEIEKLRATYGWEVRETPEWAPHGHPLGVTQRAPKRARAQVRRNKKRSGAPGGIRTPDPQVRSLMLYPAELPARVERRYRSATRSAPRAPRCGPRGARCAAPGSTRVAVPTGRRAR